MENDKDYINTKLTFKSMTNENLNQPTKSMNNPFVNILMSGVLIMLILVVLSQAFQVRRLQGYAEALTGTSITKATTTVTPQAAPKTPAAAAVPRGTTTGLPSQVGGC